MLLGPSGCLEGLRWSTVGVGCAGAFWIKKCGWV